MQKRYRILRLIALLYKILGVVVAVLFLLGSLASCISGIIGGAALSSSLNLDTTSGSLGTASSVIVGIVLAILILIYGLLVAFGLYAFGEAIYLLIALEENTRNTAVLLERQLAALPAPAPQGYVSPPYPSSPPSR